MNQWRKYGSIAVCFWSLLLVLVGVSQLIFGAYFISKLPIFKIGSPVWVGFLNILGATGLFALHQKRLELKSLLWRLHDIPKIPSKKGTSSEASFSPTGDVEDDLEPALSLPCSRRLNPLHWSLALCLVILVINVTNVLLCEVGEWHHWVRTRERPALLSPLAIQAHRVTAAQMSLAVLFGLTCTAINVWLIYKERMAKHQQIQPDPVVLESIEPVPTIERPRSKTLGFDNPNWVYGHQQQQAILQQRQQQDVQVHPELAMVEMENGSGPMRYATIRRAAPISSNIQSVGLSMDQRYPPTARIGKSASFRVDLEQHQRRNRPTAGIHRSKTMRETSFTTNENGGNYNNNTFANRFQPGRPDGPSALGFVHDALTIMEDDPDAGESPPPTTPPDEKEEPMVHQTPTPPPPPRLPVVRHNIRTSDRIVLRVESFRGVESKGRPLRPIARNQNVKRVSSSTQTDLSVLMKNSSALITMQRNTNNRRPNSSQKFTGSPIAISEIPASNEITESTTATTDAGQQVQLSPVESSSGYSSPRGTDDSKSSSPEPASLQNPQQSGSSTISSGNVTIIQIEPLIEQQIPVEIQEPSRMVEATYATPRKRSERSNSASGMMIPTTKTPPPPSVFRVSIQPHQQQLGKPLAVNRSVSFHHMSQSDRRSVYNHEWLQHPSSGLRREDDTNAVPMMSIPRPALRMVPRYVSPSPTSSSSSTHGRRRHPSGSSLNRSTSVYLAMSEIQRKLDVLQLISNNSTPNGTPQRHIVPVHNQQSPDQDYSYYNATAAQRPSSSSSGSGRTRRVSSSSKLDWNNDPLDSSAKTLAYLSELEQLARHWRTQLLYKVELKTSSSSTNRKTGVKNTVESSDTFQC